MWLTLLAQPGPTTSLNLLRQLFLRAPARLSTPRLSLSCQVGQAWRQSVVCAAHPVAAACHCRCACRCACLHTDVVLLQPHRASAVSAPRVWQQQRRLRSAVWRAGRRPGAQAAGARVDGVCGASGAHRLVQCGAIAADAALLEHLSDHPPGVHMVRTGVVRRAVPLRRRLAATHTCSLSALAALVSGPPSWCNGRLG